MNKRRILITGVTGFRNRGVEALVTPLVQHLRAALGPVEIAIASWSPEYDARRELGDGVTFFAEATLHTSFRSVLKSIRNAVAGIPRETGLPWPFEETDLMVSTGGDLFGSEYSTASLVHHLKPIGRALRHKIPVCMLAHSVGPFKLDQEAQLWAKAAAQCSLVTIREELSYNYVKNVLCVPASLVHLTADVGFLLEPAALKPDYLRTLLGVGSGDPVVAVAVSGGICRWTGVSPAQHADAWVGIIRMMLDEWGVRVMMVPHVQEPGSDDLVLATQLMRKLDFDARVFLAGGDYSAAEYKAMISQCDLVIAERMHAAIAGLSMMTPTVAVGYSVKAQGIIEFVMGAELAGQGAVIQLRDLVNPEISHPQLTKAWNNRKRFKERLTAAVPSVQQSARGNFEMLARLLP